MRTTLIIDDKLLKDAMDMTGIKEKTAVVHAGLRALLEKAARERLIAAGGTVKNNIKPVSRRRAS